MIEKPVISERFDLEDVRKIRDYNSFRHMNMTHAEIIADIREGSAGFLALLEKGRKEQKMNSPYTSKPSENMVIAEKPAEYHTNGKKERIRVMVTGVGGGGNGEQLVKALRMSDKNYELIGADITPVSKGLFLVDRKRILPPASDPKYIETLLQVCKEEGVQALFTGSEPELKKVSAVQDEIRAAGIFLPMNPQSVIETCMDKSKTMAFLDENGFAHPASVTIRSETDLEQITKFPVVLKPSIGGGGSANAYIAQDADELRLFGTWMLHIYSEFIVQEYVGNADCEYTVGVLSDMEGNLINSIAVKKNIMTALSNRLKIRSRYTGELLVISNGISQGQIGRFPEVTSQCEEIALKLGSRSAINIQLRFVDGRCFVFEINPRYSGTSSFRAMVGYNEPDIMIRKYLLGESIEPHFPYKEGYIMRGLDETFMEL